AVYAHPNQGARKPRERRGTTPREGHPGNPLRICNREVIMRRTRRPGAAGPARRRPKFQVEPLEGRALLATVNQILVAEEYELFLNRTPEPAGVFFLWAVLVPGAEPPKVGPAVCHSAGGDGGWSI